MRRNILRDTVLLTVIQMLLDGLTLLLNVFMTNRLGTEAIGILTLTTSFFRLAAVTANGNVFLCASRFISEELGKRERNPGKVLALCMGVSLVLSAAVTGLIFWFAPWCSVQFLKSEALAAPIRIMAASLPLLTVAACMKGWFNACCKAGLCAAADTIEFLVRTACMTTVILLHKPQTHAGLCNMNAFGIIAGAAAVLVFLLVMLPSCRAGATAPKASLSVGQYLRLAIPVMLGSALTSFLSSANDALVPITLRQSGSSAPEAFSQFGIFEAIIIPTLFFPSTILCSLAGILVTETAREKAGNNYCRITALTEKTLRQTIVFAIFVTMILLLFGHEIGILLGGGEIAGKMVVLLAPVVPFIYLEIVLESIIKGIGAQTFSSLNYLCEYIIRISFVLVFIPLLGFYGIVLSYYASNICGNVSRLVVVIRRTGMRPDPVKILGIPLFSAVFSAQAAGLAFTLLHAAPGGSVPAMVLFTLLSGIVYLFLQRVLFRLYGAIPADAPLLPLPEGLQRK